MEQSLPFFNWSLKKLLISECDKFEKAKSKILFWIFILSIIKTIVVVTIALNYKQEYQLQRAVVMLLVFIILLKLLLVNKSYNQTITHFMLWLGLFNIWSNTFFYAQHVNIVTIQIIAMVLLSSFYLLNLRYAFFYAFLSTVPIIVEMIFPGLKSFSGILPNILASPGFEIIIVLNFVTIVVCHYFFQKAILSNIAEKQELNELLKVSVNEANLASASKSDFLSTMSHELRTPLNSVIGITELLLNDKHSEEQAENLKILKFSATSLHSLINDILDYNKLGSDKVELETISVDIYQLIKDSSSGLLFQAKKQGIDFILDVDDNLIGQRIITDPTRITQIIYNLAGNAIKFTQKGSVTLSLKVICDEPDCIKIKFSIIDTGIGISLDKQESIFEPFTQASSSTTRNFGGTGLGLSIVKRLLFLFESRIHVESMPGNGSTFFFEISFLPEKEPIYTNVDVLETVYDISELKVLVAEDNPMNRTLITKIFSKWNNKPEFAFNGSEAVEKLLSNDYDIVLMDLHMPILDGYEATKAIRSLPDPVKSKIRIIALTASVSSNLYDKIKLAGMDDFLLKPFKLNELYSKLKELPIQL